LSIAFWCGVHTINQKLWNWRRCSPAPLNRIPSFLKEKHCWARTGYRNSISTTYCLSGVIIRSCVFWNDNTLLLEHLHQRLSNRHRNSVDVRYWSRWPSLPPFGEGLSLLVPPINRKLDLARIPLFFLQFRSSSNSKVHTKRYNTSKKLQWCYDTIWIAHFYKRTE
jgi:hypothetical protein